jgi:hypothetical protein
VLIFLWSICYSIEKYVTPENKDVPGHSDAYPCGQDFLTAVCQCLLYGKGFSMYVDTPSLNLDKGVYGGVLLLNRNYNWRVRQEVIIA